MALKDWKKEPYRNEWTKTNKEHSGQRIDVAWSGKDAIFRVFRIYHHKTLDTPLSQQKFKNQILALRYARRYMRKH